MLVLPEVWERFYEYKNSLTNRGPFEKELRRFIDEERYLPVFRKITQGDPFPLPFRSIISKMDTEKKRVVYTYPEPENTVLKMLTWLLLRKYNDIFTSNLYSFRPGRSAKDAIRHLQTVPGIRDMYSYKADISNYFNSISVPQLLPVLEQVLADDEELFRFLSRLLAEPDVLEKPPHTKTGNTKKTGKPGKSSPAETVNDPGPSREIRAITPGLNRITEQKGIMAGTPLSAFYANLYLYDLDRHFKEAGIPYARYSDDIIVFAASREQVREHAAYIRDFLQQKGLKLNPAKEEFHSPEEGWIFLGFSYCDGIIDIAPASVIKIKGKMRRKCRALRRWACRSGADPHRAAAAFIRIFNRKLMGESLDHKNQNREIIESDIESEKESPEKFPQNELTWSRWFFPVINTDNSLQVIDHYAQECLRYLLSGTHTKKRFNIRYEDLKALGYQSLVHAYYAYNK